MAWSRFSLQKLFQGSLWLLPYASYLGLLGLVGGLVGAFKAPHPPVATRVTQFFWVLGGALLVSCGFAYNRAEAFLQLGNFFPFFLLFVALPLVFRQFEQWRIAALGLVLTIVPLPLLSLVEYVFKAFRMPALWRQMPWIREIYTSPHRGRAMVTFDHPNAFASYLVILLGLALGLLLSQLARRPKGMKGFDRTTLGLGVAIAACLLGIFTSGSRNGLLVAISQLALFVFCSPLPRMVLMGVASGVVALLGGALALGIGGRSLSPATWADDPRVGVWRVAWELIQERPWLGWGLGNYKLVFPPRTFDPVEYANVYHPHNIFLLFASETGVFVLLLATLGVGYCWYRAVRVWVGRSLPPPENHVLLGFLLAFWGCFAYSLLDLTFYDGRVNTVNWFVLAGLYWFGHTYPRASKAETLP